jgi:hypothetical protein
MALKILKMEEDDGRFDENITGTYWLLLSLAGLTKRFANRRIGFEYGGIGIAVRRDTDNDGGCL